MTCRNLRMRVRALRGGSRTIVIWPLGPRACAVGLLFGANRCSWAASLPFRLAKSLARGRLSLLCALRPALPPLFARAEGQLSRRVRKLRRHGPQAGGLAGHQSTRVRRTLRRPAACDHSAHHFVAQVILLSATMPIEVLGVARRPMCRKEQLTLEGTKQSSVAVEREEWKLDASCDLYENSRPRAPWSSPTIAGSSTGSPRTCTAAASPPPPSGMHFAMAQQERADAVREFRTGSSRFLIAVHLHAHGIDLLQDSSANPAALN